MVGGHGLDHGPAREIPPACPAHHLGQHIKGGLPCPEASGEQAQVSVQYADQRHIGQIQALGHHLGAKQNFLLPCPESSQNGLMGIGGADGVRIHPGHGHIGKQLRQLLLHPLGAGAQSFQGPAAFGAPVRHRHGKAAVMAHEPPVGTVIGQPFAAPGALRGLPAVHAHQGPGVAPAVQQQNGLLARLHRFAEGLAQRVAQAAVVAQL